MFTFALLDALARGDRDGDGFVSVTELIEHIDRLVPEITAKTWGRRQVPRSLVQGTNFSLAKQVPAIAPAPGDEVVIWAKPTHYTKRYVDIFVDIFKEAGGKGAIVQQLPPNSMVTLVWSDQGWALIARDGKVLGYVAEDQLEELT